MNKYFRRFFCRNRIVEGTDALGHFDEIEHVIIKVPMDK